MHAPSNERTQGGAEGYRTHDRTRRQFVRAVGAGAIALSGGGSVAGAATAQADGPTVHGVDSWDLRTERIDQSAVEDGPTVEFDGETVLVTGTHVFSRTGCDTFEPRRISVREADARLGVVIDTATTGGEEQVCLQALMPLRYELEVVPATSVESATVDEAFADAAPTAHYRGEPPAIDLPDAVADYEFTVGGVDSAPEPDAPPSVAFEDDSVVVEGALTYGSSSCNEVALASVSSDAAGHVGAEVVGRWAPTAVPGGPCTADVATASYRLELTIATDASVHVATATERGQRGTRSEATLRDGTSAGQTDGVRAYDVRTTTDASAEAVEAPPTVRPGLGGSGAGDTEAGDGDADDGATVVRIEGTVDSDPSCVQVALTDVRWTGEDESALVATVGLHSLPDAYCQPDPGVPVAYAVDVLVDGRPTTFTAEELRAAEDEPPRSVTVPIAACEGAATVEGQTVCDVSGDGDYRDVTGDGAVGQGDVAAFFQRQHRSTWKRPELFDFSGNGAVTHGDVVDLFDHVALQ